MLLILSTCLGNYTTSAAAAPAASTVDLPSAPAWGHFIDTYKNNTTVNNAVYSNPTIGVLSQFLELYAPGTSWDTGTKLNSSVLDANIQTVVDAAYSRTAAEEAMAYYDDRRDQSYGVIEGLGTLADVYRTKAGATTTIIDIPADATTKTYNDAGTGAGDKNSELGKIVTLVRTLRGNYSSTNPAKSFYSYPRPFRWLKDNSVVVPTLIPRISSNPATDGGFPSGHTNASYLAGIAMAYSTPERFQELLTRASEMGQSRIVAGHHSPLDVMGGRVMATALSAAILADPDNAAIKQAAYDEAHTKLLTQTGTAEDRFSDYAKNKEDFTKRLTYDFDPISSTTKPMVVPKGAEVLLETRLPYLDGTQRRAVLATTGLPSGYPLLDDPEGWGRLNLFAAADGYGAFDNDITVTMDADKGGFHALDRWRNDISGIGKLTKEGSGTLMLQGSNTYSGGTQINEGTLEGDSSAAFGTGDVAVNEGTLVEHVSGKMMIGGNYTQAAGGTLELNLGSTNDLLEIKGAVNANGKLRLNFADQYVLANSVITIMTHGKDQRTGQFSSVETAGLPSQFKVKLIYQSDRIQLAVDEAAPSWTAGASLTGSNIGQTSLTLNWPAAADNVGVDSYNVYQGSTMLGTVTGSTYSVTGLSAGTSYSFSVTANDLAGNQSGPLNATLFTASNVTYYPPSSGQKPDSKPEPETEPLPAVGNQNKQSVSIAATADSNGRAIAEVQDSQLNDLLNKVNSLTGENIIAELKVKTVENAKAAGLILSKNAIVKLSDSKAAEVEIVTQFGSLTLNKAVLDSLEKTSGDAIRIEMAAASKDGFASEAKRLIGTRPALEFTIQSGTADITSFDGSSIKIRIPYKPEQGEDINALVISYIDPSGMPYILPVSGYQRDGQMYLITDHLSTYAVSYNNANFSDTSNHWADSYITYLASHGIASGTGSSMFSPNADITRAEFVKMLAGIANADVSVYPSSAFRDVKASDWYMPYAAWAAEKNVVKGNSNMQFRPNARISREEMCVMLNRFADLTGYQLPADAGTASFADQHLISAWAADAVSALYKAGIVSGKGNQQFDPQGGATRAEAAKLLTVFLQGMND
nr:S-layer homology domain-containing protein [Paenibacillus sp. sptzw28]